MVNIAKLVFSLLILNSILPGVALCQLPDTELQSRTGIKLKASLQSEIDDLQSQYEKRAAELKEQFIEKLDIVRKNAANKIQIAKSAATKADQLDKALELRSFSEALDKLPTNSLLQATSKSESRNARLANGLWVGNVANKKDRITLEIAGGRRKTANWNGKGRLQIESVGGRNWVQSVGGDYAEIVHHQDMLILMVWSGKLGDELPTRHPKRLGILYPDK